MASGDKEQPLCRVCKTVFTFKGPEPLLLPCLHATCKPCVDSEQDTITCATCRQLFHKADHTFPKHAILSRDLFQLTLKQTPSEIVCSNRSDGAKAETWCPKCEAFLCSTCQEFHKESKATRDHIVESLQNALDPETGGTWTRGYCKTHREHPLEVFDSSCRFLVCYKCLKVDHSTCSVNDIDEAFGKMKESELDNSIEQIVARLEVINGMEQKAKDLAKELDENSKRVSDEVMTTFSDIRKTLDMREKVILEETSQSFHEVQNANTERLEVLKQEKIRCEEALQFIKRSKEVTDPIQSLRMKKTIDERTEVCTKADLHKIDGRESNIVLSTQDLSDVKHSIATFAGLMSVYDEDALKNAISGPTTLEKQNKKLIQLEKEVKAYRQTLERIPLLIEQRHKQGKIDLKVPGISAIACEISFDSITRYLNNIPWYLSAQLANEDDTIMLGLFLCPDVDVVEVGKKWACGVRAKFEITNSFSKGLAKEEEIRHEFTDKEKDGWGHGSIVSLKELQDPLKGFAQDDCINVSVDVEILKTTGFLSLEELIMKECEDTLSKTY